MLTLTLKLKMCWLTGDMDVITQLKRFSKCIPKWTFSSIRSSFIGLDLARSGYIGNLHCFLKQSQLLWGFVFTSWGLTVPDWLILLCFISSLIPSHRNRWEPLELCCLNCASRHIFQQEETSFYTVRSSKSTTCDSVKCSNNCYIPPPHLLLFTSA